MDDTLGTVGDVGHDDVISLVGGVAEEIALEYGMGVGQTAEQTVVSVHHGFQLAGVSQLRGADVNHRMVFSNLRAVVETPDLGTGILKVYL